MGFRCVTAKNGPSLRKLTCSALHAATLELKSEKTNAHSYEIYSVAFSPDGKKIVSGSDDGSIKVWDSGT